MYLHPYFTLMSHHKQESYFVHVQSVLFSLCTNGLFLSAIDSSRMSQEDLESDALFIQSSMLIECGTIEYNVCYNFSHSYYRWRSSSDYCTGSWSTGLWVTVVLMNVDLLRLWRTGTTILCSVVTDVSHGFGQPIWLSEWSGSDSVLNLALVIRALTLSGFKDKVQYEKSQKKAGKIAKG